MQSRLCIILPTLNERENIVPQIREILFYLPRIGQIVVVDDQSTDGTVEEVERAFRSEIEAGRIQILVRTQSPGLTASLQDGIRRADGWDLVAWMDCDLSMPADVYHRMLTTIENGFDICVGSRFSPGGEQKRWWRAGKDSRLEIVLSNMGNRVLRWLTGLPITDFTSGFIVAKRSVLNRTALRGHHGEYFMHMIAAAHRGGARVCEVPYTCRNRVHGHSKTSADLKTLLRNCFRYGKAVLEVAFGKFASI